MRLSESLVQPRSRATALKFHLFHFGRTGKTLLTRAALALSFKARFAQAFLFIS